MQLSQPIRRTKDKWQKLISDQARSGLFAKQYCPKIPLVMPVFASGANCLEKHRLGWRRKHKSIIISLDAYLRYSLMTSILGWNEFCIALVENVHK